jgi:hypothetical protein
MPSTLQKIPNSILKALEKEAALERQVKRLQERSSEQLETLSMDFRSRVELVMAHLASKGWKPVVYHGERSPEEQAEKVRAGASKLSNSLHVPGSLQKPRIRNGIYSVVAGEAADIIDARYLWSGPAKDLNYQFWNDLGAYAKVQGLAWGGDWKKFRDVAHVELPTRRYYQDTRGLMA